VSIRGDDGVEHVAGGRPTWSEGRYEAPDAYPSSRSAASRKSFRLTMLYRSKTARVL